MNIFWRSWTEDWTDEQLSLHLKQGWTVEKLVDVYKFKKEENEELYKTYFLDHLINFAAQGHYVGNYDPHQYIVPTFLNEWGRRDWSEHPCDPTGFVLDFHKTKDHFIGKIRRDGSDVCQSDEHILNFSVLKAVWKREYLPGYERLGYLAGHKGFLDTIYWNVIRAYLIHTRGYKCQECGNPGYMAVSSVLEVHHKHYRVHGIEHLCLDTLLVLHRECHQSLHAQGQNPYTYYR